MLHRNNIKEARLRGLRTWYGSAVSDWAIEEMDLTGIGRLFAMTPNDEVNTLTALHYVHEFGRDRVYQLPPAGSDRPRDESAPKEMRGRTLFAQDASFARLASRFGRGARIKATALTEQFGWEDLQKEQDGRGLPLFLLQDKGQLKIATVDQPLKPLPGHTVFSLLDPPAEDTEAPEKSGAGGNETSG